MDMKAIKQRVKQGLTAAIAHAKKLLASDDRDFTLALILVFIVMVNVVSAQVNFRVDLTRSRTYALTDRSKEVVANLKENLKVKVFFSQDDPPPQFAALYRYLVDLLDEYRFHGNRHFSYELVPQKDLEKEAAAYGIRQLQSQEFANDQMKVRRSYMGVVILQADAVEKVDAITDPAGLEYLLTSRIMRVSNKIDGLRGLKKPIEVTLYLDDAMRQLPIEGVTDLDKKVKAAVDKANAANYGKLAFRAIDPSADKEGAGAAEKYGLKKIKWGAGVMRDGRQQPAGEAVFGVTLVGPGRFQVIDIDVAPSLMGGYGLVGIDNLDDRIGSAVGNIVSSSPRVGYVTGHGEVELRDEQSPTGGGLLNRLLADLYEVRTLDLAKEDIPADLNLVIVNGPKKEFTPVELFRLDQYLMKGKAALFFIDSFQEINLPGGQMMGRQAPVLPVHANLEGLLGAYGVRVNRDIVLDPVCAKVNLGNMIKDYPLLPRIGEQGLSRQNEATRFLKEVAFFKASSVSAETPKGAKPPRRALTLVSSSPESWTMTDNINFHPLYMERDKAEGMRAYPLAVLMSGRFTSHFRERGVPDELRKKETGTISALRVIGETVSSGTSEIIVVGSSTVTQSGFLADSRRILHRQTSDQESSEFANAIFLRNLVDYLAGNRAIPEMRSKSLDHNPLRKTSDAARNVMKALNLVGVPLLVVLAWLVIWKRRQARRRRIMERFSGEGGL